MLSHFDTIAECDGQTDGRAELLYQYRASPLLCWRAIKKFNTDRVQKAHRRYDTIRYDMQVFTVQSKHW